MHWPKSLFVWNAYFLFKLYLYAKGSIAHDVLLNLAFLALVAAPLPERFARRRVAAARQALNAALAVALLWRDSWLPPPLEGWAQLEQQGMPSFAYIVSFLLGYFDGPLLAVIAGTLVAAFLLRRWPAATTAVVALALVAAPWVVAWSAGPAKPAKAAQAQERPTEPGALLEDFYAREAERVVLFKKASDPPFDVILIHVCSMAWSDLRAVKLDQHPFFKDMHWVFTAFNSASSYSNPAVTRLMRANCGQTTHRDLYSESSPSCFMFESLKGIGFSNYVVMSHDGKYGHYTEDIKKNGMADATYLFPDKMKPQSIFFDDSNMFSDQDMLKRWLDVRGASGAKRAAVYFNSVNLHAGSHWVDEKKWWARDPKEQYEDFASFQLHGLKKFVDGLAATGRNYLVVFLPEHGRALVSTPMQGKDLREIPLPGITRVPLTLQFIGPGFKAPPAQVVVDKPTSYFALAWLLARFAEKSPFGPGADAPADLVRRIPATDFVADHSGTTIIEMGGQYFMNQPKKSEEWLQLTPSQLGE